MDLNNKQTRLLIGTLLIVLIGVGVYEWKNSDSSSVASPSTPASSTRVNGMARPDVHVTESKEAVVASKKAPEGFPSDIPLEFSSITESYKAFYKNNNVTQYTVSYTSTHSKSDLLKTYSDYFMQNGYVLDTASTNTVSGSITGVKGNSTLSVVVSNPGIGAFVQLNLLTR